LASISAPFWEPFAIIFMFFRHRFLHRFLIDFLVGNGTKMWPRLLPGNYLFRFFFITLVSFTHVIPTSARKQFFQLF
jgi:hypothetical protein